MTTSGKTLTISGVWCQIYRGATGCPAVGTAAMDAALTELKDLGFIGVAWHGFSSEMGPDKFKLLAAQASKHGLLSMAAYGLDNTDPIGKAQRMAKVAILPECYALVLDQEGAWEHAGNDDKLRATQMGVELRKLCPNVLIIDQPWPLPTFHWTSFPWEEISAYVDAHAPQLYFNDWKAQMGTERYKKLVPQFAAAWQKLDARLQPKGLVRQEIATIQGYGWDDIFADLVNCLTKNDKLIVWCEWFPKDSFKKAMKVKQKLLSLGFSGSEAVKMFQTSVGLTADNVCGPNTLLKLNV